MYNLETFDTINFIVFQGDVSIQDVQQLGADLLTAAEKEGGAFAIVITVNVTSFPKLGELISELKSLHKTASAIQRIYGFDENQKNKAMALISNIGTQIIGLNGKIVNVTSNDALIKQLEKDSAIFPGLQGAVHHFDAIYQRLNELQPTPTTTD